MKMTSKSVKDRLEELARRREELLARTPEAELRAIEAEEARLREELAAAEREEARARQGEIKAEVHRLFSELAPHALAIVKACERLQQLVAESCKLALDKGVGPQTNAPASSRALARHARAWLEELERFAPDLARRFKPPPRPEVEIKIHSADELMKGG